MAEAAESKISFSSYFNSVKDSVTSAAFPQLYVMLQDIKKEDEKRREVDKTGGASNKILSDDLREIHTTLEEMSVVLESSREEHIKTNQLLERLVEKGGSGGGGKSIIDEAEELAVFELLEKAAVRLLPLLVRSIATGGAVATLAYEDEIKKYAINPALGKITGLSEEEQKKRQDDYNSSTFMGNLQQDIDGWKKVFGFGGPSKSDQFDLGNKYVDDAIKTEKKNLEGFTKKYEEEQKLVAGLAAEIERQKKDGQDVTENQKLLLKLQETLAEDLKLKTESEKTLFELQKSKDNAPVPGVPNIPNITDQGVQKNPDGTVQDSSGRTILQTAKPFTFEDSIKGMEAPSIDYSSVSRGIDKNNHDVSELQKRIGAATPGGSVPENFHPVDVGDYKSLPEINKHSGRGSFDYEAYAMNYFKSKGYSPEEAAHIMGNIKQESGFDPNSINKNDAGPGKDSVGLAQWNKNRLEGMKSFSEKMYDKPYNSLTTQEKFQSQLGYIDHELHTNYASAMKALKRGDFGSFGHLYEGYGDQSEGTRVNNGKQILARENSGSYRGHAGASVATLGKDISKDVVAYADDYKSGDGHVGIDQQIEKVNKIVDDTKQFSDDRMISKPEDQEQLYKTAWSDNMKYGDGNQGVPGQSSGDFDPSNNRRAILSGESDGRYHFAPGDSDPSIMNKSRPINWEDKNPSQIETLPNQDQIAINLLRNNMINNNQFGDLSGGMESVHGDVDSNLSTQLLRESFDNSVEDHGRHKDNNQVQKQFTDDFKDHGRHKDKNDKHDVPVVSPPDHLLQKYFTTPPS